MSKGKIASIAASLAKRASSRKSETGPTRKPVKQSSAPVLTYSAREAKAFFLKAESYCNLDLPPYFGFTDVLADLDEALSGKNLSDFRKNGSNSRNFDDVNYRILNNKDGKYAWRPFSLIHPALYVSLVHQITTDLAWKKIQKRFDEFSQNPKIECVSRPVESTTVSKDKAGQILHWWEHLEQQSIKLALEFECLLKTDVTDCYSSIYTHSVAWAMHGKDVAKAKRTQRSLLGNIIDNHLQDMSHGQTNGIPQGSVLMDFIAELVLGYADLLLSEKIQKAEIEDYRILRYRDDYRIFTNSPQDSEAIAKLLTEILIDLGLKLNPSKTDATNQVIRDSVKDDKLFWNRKKQSAETLQKHLLIIHDLSVQFPNSGSLMRALNDFHSRISGVKEIRESPVVLISIITDIAFHNPRTYPICTAIMSEFFCQISDDEEKKSVIGRVRKRFNQIPNIGFLEIWLQRLTLPFGDTFEYEEPLCQLVAKGNVQIWNSEWLQPGLGKFLDARKIVADDKIEALPSAISLEEVELFLSRYWDS